MPTGSLCSERAAIAAALAQDPTLTRADFRMIGVLSLAPQTDTSTAPLAEKTWPARLDHASAAAAGTTRTESALSIVDSISCTSVSSLTSSSSPSLSAAAPDVAATVETNPEPSAAVGSTNRSLFAAVSAAAATTPNHQGLLAAPKTSGAPIPAITVPGSAYAVKTVSSPHLSSVMASTNSLAGPVFELIPAAASHGCAAIRSQSSNASAASSVMSSPVIGASWTELESQSSFMGSPVTGPATPSKERRSSALLPRNVSDFRSLVLSKTDLNPLAPCGACKEWLKKIAEVNPDFKVITFSNPQLESVFVDPVIDWS
jgi:hypothetical protein